MTACTSEDNPSTVDIDALERELVGVWWDEYEYADVTETGVPFSRVLLAVKADAEKAADIKEKMQAGGLNTNLPGSDALHIEDTPGNGWGR
jgi:hypothetical protein